MALAARNGEELPTMAELLAEEGGSDDEGEASARAMEGGGEALPLRCGVRRPRILQP